MIEQRMGRLLSLSDLVKAGQMAPQAPELPMNTMRNNDTGAEYQFESAPRGGQGGQGLIPLHRCGAGSGTNAGAPSRSITASSRASRLAASSRSCSAAATQRRNRLAFSPFASATAAIDTPGCRHAPITSRLNSAL